MVEVIKKIPEGYVVEFSLPGKPGHENFVAGSFNDWAPECAPMEFSAADDCYRRKLTLPPGSYEYKFVVDGRWILDDSNPNFTANDFGTLNSVLNLGY